MCQHDFQAKSMLQKKRAKKRRSNESDRSEEKSFFGQANKEGKREETPPKMTLSKARQTLSRSVQRW
ncbi:hypothetical protein M011DRAFT_465192 [Sporormia fimetaria CBS 119925]|uniref:Uncharacterized protein n=1 Tax=Sporormia fimetaria CBS 119925 TaxID=1340428 RepID=A0A6A6VMJ5_9PLEO|nr:hypothetical protein M011DRAFT_465192 [Sporormia fimetaria CBS 119925]